MSDAVATTPGTSAGAQRPPRRRLPRWALVLLGVLGAVVLLLVAFVVWFVAMLSGGLDDLFGGSGPSPDDPQVVEARDEAEASAEAALSEVRATVGGPELLALAGTERCDEGQHNWKIDDPYDLSCSLRIVNIVTGGELDGFREDMTALDAALVADGWEPGWSTMDEVLTGYWDRREEALDNNPGWTYPARMPSTTYARDDLTLSVSWVEPTADSAGGLEYDDDIIWTTPEGRSLGVAAVPGLVDAGHYGVALGVSETYFER